MGKHYCESNIRERILERENALWWNRRTGPTTVKPPPFSPPNYFPPTDLSLRQMEASGKRFEAGEKRGTGKKSVINIVHGANEKAPDLRPIGQNSRKLATEDGHALHGNMVRTTYTLDRQGFENPGRTNFPEKGENAELVQKKLCSAVAESGQLEANGGRNRTLVPMVAVESDMGNDGMDSINLSRGGAPREMSAALGVPLPIDMNETLPATGIEVTSKDSSDLGKAGAASEGDSGISRGRSRAPAVRKKEDNGRNEGWVGNGMRNGIQPGRTFASLLNANPIGKKMKMDFVKPVMEGEQPVFVPKDEVILQAKKKWESYLVGYFISGSLPFNSVDRAARGYWGKLGLGKILADASGFYFFEFADANDRIRVLEEGPWLFYGRGMVLQQWSPELALCKQSHDKIPLWARFHRVPLTLWTAAGLSGIASLVGRPLYADSYTENMMKIDFARICIEVEARKPLPETVVVKMAGEVLHIPVDYQWKPMRCSRCEVFGHSCKTEQTEEQQGYVAPAAGTGQVQSTLVLCTGAKEGFTLIQSRKNNSMSAGTSEANCRDAQEQAKMKEKGMTQKRKISGEDRSAQEVGTRGIEVSPIAQVTKDSRITQRKQQEDRVEACSNHALSSSPSSSEGSDTENESNEEAFSNVADELGEHVAKGMDDKPAASGDYDHGEVQSQQAREAALAQVVAAMPNEQFLRKITNNTPPKKTKRSAGKSKASKPRRR